MNMKNRNGTSLDFKRRDAKQIVFTSSNLEANVFWELSLISVYFICSDEARRVYKMLYYGCLYSAMLLLILINKNNYSY
jgi:hypothetical protein